MCTEGFHNSIKINTVTESVKSSTQKLEKETWEGNKVITDLP
jgi:hypothetical protein